MSILGINIDRAMDALSKSTTEHSPERQTAVRWFNRFYYDLSSWNREFTTLLKEYPGFKNSNTPEDFVIYDDRLKAYVNHLQSEELDNSHYYWRREVDICQRLDFLSEKLETDFHWLKIKDLNTYSQLERSVGQVKFFPGLYNSASKYLAETVINLSHQIIYDNWDYEEIRPLNTVEEVKHIITEYIIQSDKLLKDVWNEGRKVGLLLLTVAEYDEALEGKKSSDQSVIIIGEIDMSQDTFNINNYGGNVNIKSTLSKVQQSIKTSPNLLEPDRTELYEIIYKLNKTLEDIPDSSCHDAERLVGQVELATKELSHPKPSGELLHNIAGGILTASKALATACPAIIAITDKIVELITKY